MPATPRAAARPLAAALGLTAALLATTPPADAGLLDEPPKRATFNLNETIAPELPLLRVFRNAAVERPGPLRLYLSSAYGRWRHQPWWQLAWGGARTHADDAPGERGLTAGLRASDFASTRASFSPFAPLSPFALPDSPFAVPDTLHLEPITPAWTWLRQLDPSFTPPMLATTGPSLLSNGFDLIWDPPKEQPLDVRCQRGPVRFARYGGQHDAFELVRCDGSVAPGALDRLSIMARPPEAPDPGKSLPDEPDEGTWQRTHEWVPQIRLVHPRLLWVLQQIADAFPRRVIYIYSGYRPRPPDEDPRARRKRAGGHHSQHAEGRAVDIAVTGVPNAALFRFCRTLNDVACGFYPNSKFVHVDVRRPGTGRLFWIDASGPGEPSRYVDAWPGVVEGGGLSWGVQGAPSDAPSSR